MSDHDVREALARYAATAPDLDPRAGLPERLARRDRLRRATAAGVAGVAVLVAGTGLVVVTRGDGTAAIVATGDPTPSAAPTASAATSPTPSGSAVAPSLGPDSVRPTGDPGATASASADGAAPTAGRYEPPDAPGLTATAVLEPEALATATYATLTVHAEDGDGRPRVASVEWGDGAVHSVPQAVPGCVWTGPAPTSRPAEPGQHDEEFTHAWRKDGRYTITVVVTSSTMCSRPQARYEEQRLTVEVEVSQGAIMSNGPAQPYDDYFVADRTSNGKDEWFVSAALRDMDGHIVSASLDWGDGSEPVEDFAQDECRDGDGAHYPESIMNVHDWRPLPPGTYTVTLTWVSAGCDGEDVQETTRTRRVVVPG